MTCAGWLGTLDLSERGGWAWVGWLGTLDVSERGGWAWAGWLDTLDVRERVDWAWVGWLSTLDVHGVCEREGESPVELVFLGVFHLVNCMI